MKYDNEKIDLFEKRAMEWIEQEKKLSGISDNSVSSLIFNVIDAYRDLIRFPDSCPGCTRSGRDHDGECPTPKWKGKDFGLF